MTRSPTRPHTTPSQPLRPAALLLRGTSNPNARQLASPLTQSQSLLRTEAAVAAVAAYMSSSRRHSPLHLRQNRHLLNHASESSLSRGPRLPPRSLPHSPP